MFRRGQYAGEYSGYQDRGNIAYTKPPRPYDNFSGGSSEGDQALIFRPNWGPKTGTGTGIPFISGSGWPLPLLLICRSEFWQFSHCMDRSSNVKRIREEQCFAGCLGRLILSVNLSIYKYDFHSSISPSRQVVAFLIMTCTLNEQVVEHLFDRPICPSTRVKTAMALIHDYVRRANFTTKSRL